MTSSTKPEVRSVRVALPSEKDRTKAINEYLIALTEPRLHVTCTENFVEFRRVVF